MRDIRTRSNGLALAVILLAVVLLAAIAAAIVKSSQLGNDMGNPEKDKLLATNIMAQAQAIKNGVELAVSNATDISTITATNTGNAITFSPASAGIASQVVPVQASTNASSFYWVWQGANALVQIMNVGTGAGNYVIELDPLTQSVCQQINQAIFGDPTVPSSATTNWGTNHSVDASAESVLSGKQETCFYSTAYTRYVYYKVVMVQ